MLNKINMFMALTILGLLLSDPVMADINDNQTWGNITAVGSLNSFNPALKNFKYWAEFQGRFGDNTSRFSQAIIRPGIGYVINNTTSVWLGYALVHTAEPFSKTTFNERRLRLRQLFKVWVSLTAAPGYSVVASDEYYLNLNNADWGPRKGFDQNRAFIGMGYDFDKEIKTEIGYMNQYINRPHTSINRNDHILSINFYLNY